MTKPRTYIFCWNPTRWTWETFDADVRRLKNGKRPPQSSWSTGRNRSIVAGERFFLLRQATERGIVGSGYTTSNVHDTEHWDGSDRTANSVGCQFETLLPVEDRLPTETLVERLPEVAWMRIQGSGVSVPTDVAEHLASLWDQHLNSLSVSQVTLPTEVSVPLRYVEGATKQVAVNAYERNKKAREACLQHYGYACVVCGFDFEKVYGEIGSGFIHVHHLKDLATIGMEYEVKPIRDLRPVCPNCHAMLHTSSPAMSIESLRSLLASSQERHV